MTISEPGIQLIQGASASQILYTCLDAAVQAYPEVFKEIRFPKQARDFKRHYAAVLPRFEAARINQPNRADIARLLAETFQAQLVYQSDLGVQSLQDHLATPSQALPLERLSGNCQPSWQPNLQFLNQDWPNLTSLGEALSSKNIISSDAKTALNWLAQNLEDPQHINLSQRKVVIFGASAEMAPTAQFNAAGAEILWLDLAAPTRLAASQSRGGGIQFVADGVNLLTQPAEILATILAFAADEPVDLCLYAYAPGQAREMRLTAAMNAIINALPAALVRSTTLLLSPTTATPLDANDLLALTQRKNSRPLWEAALARLGLLGRGGGAALQGAQGASRSVVGIQGASYQAAQYLAKLMTAETWLQHGAFPVSAARPIRVSANTAPITQTRSIAHPVFDAAFGGAAALGVRTFTPGQAQTLNGLLAVHDWLNPARPVLGKIRVHGGIHTLPYPMDTALLVAAAIGFAQNPKLLAGLFKR